MRTLLKSCLAAFLVSVACAFPGRMQSMAQTSEPLAELASHALKEGQEASLNAGFASLLGISSGKSAIPLKRLTIVTVATTNLVNVSLQDKQAIIMTTREGALSTYYLTDLSGKLKKAMVNDGRIKNGGLTNLPLTQAQTNFEKNKKMWSQRPGQSGPRP